ncbi:conserved methylase [Cryptosporidium canis]|uniref:Protein-lysine N-methyltransferase OJ252_2027 n=1 Tax=Cryptosporidium canis TaxID=195482 RepID=A0ABQ8P6F8_9CRYT|nr:conserved methylase [Cryptosporidium canis]KAJ1611170.1 conserved methylase [Cryptosporidium canis]
MESESAYRSKLTNKSYWNEFYENELESYNDVGYRGEEWFEDYIEAILDWIMEAGCGEEPGRVLDVGCGNGLFLIDLMKSANFASAVGIDYIPSAIELAEKIVKEEGLSDKISLHPIDLVTGRNVSKSNEKEVVNLGKFEIVIDKGTYDIFVMKDETNIYKESVSRYLKNGSILFISSCNSTPEELCTVFDDKVCFERVSELPHKSYSYNGVEGQVLASVAFKYIKG